MVASSYAYYNHKYAPAEGMPAKSCGRPATATVQVTTEAAATKACESYFVLVLIHPHIYTIAQNNK